MDPAAQGNGWARSLRLAPETASAHHTDEFDDGDDAAVSSAEFGNPQIIIRRGDTATLHANMTLPDGEDPAVVAVNAVVMSDVNGWRSNFYTFKPHIGGGVASPLSCVTEQASTATRLVLSIVLPDDLPVRSPHAVSASIFGH